jgi:hypothetical protein
VAARGRTNHRLFNFGLVSVAVLLGYFAYNGSVDDPLHLYLGLLMIIGATLPALLWARKNDQRFPVFEVMMLTGVNTYAIPLLSGHEQLQAYSASTITSSAIGIVLFQFVANSVYALSAGRPRTSALWTEEVISSNIANYLSWGMIITTAYTMVNLLTDWIPGDLNSVIRAVCYGAGIISTFIQSRQWGQGAFPAHRKATFIVQLALQVIFSWAALFLIGGISILVLALLGYVSGGKKMPVLALVIVLPILAVLHNGKSVMREKYWEGASPFPSLTGIPNFYLEWIGNGLDPSAARQADSRRAGSKLLERTSLFHIMCLVVDNTPARQPFLDGLTYSYIPAQFIPSFFWNGKPPAHVATNKLSVYYGLQSEGATAKTTIAFGMVTEAYANYGFFGIALLAATAGFVIKKIGDWASFSPILSYPGLLLVVLMAWSFQSELTMAAWLSSLYQACIAVLGVPFVLRNFLADHERDLHHPIAPLSGGDFASHPVLQPVVPMAAPAYQPGAESFLSVGVWCHDAA